MKNFTLFIISKFLKESQCTHAKFRELISSFLLSTNKIQNNNSSILSEANNVKVSFLIFSNLLKGKFESNLTPAFSFLSTSKNYYYV